MALFYRDVSKDYIINTSSKEPVFNNKYSETFPDLEKAIDYLINNYNQRKSELYLDGWCRELHIKDLEKELKDTKIKIIK